MTTLEPKLTQQQFNKLQELHDKGDRTGVYLYYSMFMNSDQALEQAKISSFSGPLGAIAEIVNKNLQSHPNYPTVGVDGFSKEIGSDFFNEVKKSYDRGEGGRFNDLDIATMALKVWEKHGLKDISPVNFEVANEAFWELDWISTTKESFTPGFWKAFKGGLDYSFTNEKMGRKEVDFPLKSGKYEPHVSYDMEIFYITNKETGHHVFVDTTGAIQVDNNRYMVTGESKEQIALKYNVPLDQITENTPTYTIEHYESGSPLAPVPRFTITVGTNSKKQLDFSSNDAMNRFDEILQYQDKNTIKKVAEVLFSQKTEKNSCTAEVETGGSCKAENLDDIQGKGTYFNPDEVQKLYQTLDKKGIILDRSVIYSETSGSAHKVEKGDTFWDIANNNQIGINELLSIPGNEKYVSRRYTDKNGMDNIRLYEGDKISLPSSSNEYFTYSYWSKWLPSVLSGFREEKIFQDYELQSQYRFLSGFNYGLYSSPYMIDKHIVSPFSMWNNGVSDYSMEYLRLMEKLKQVEFSLWKVGDFARSNFKEGKEYQDTCHDSKCEQEYTEPIYQSERYYEPKYKSGAWDMGMPTALPIKNYEIVHGDNYIGIRGDAGEVGISLGRERGLWEHPMAVGPRMGPIWHPVVVDLKDKGLDLYDLNESPVFFDINDDNYAENTGWIKSGMGLLCYDIGDDGIINTSKEVSFKLWLEGAKTDLDGLRSIFDTNKDGILDKNDEEFNKFVIWEDRNANGISEIGEIKKLESYGIKGLVLNGKKEDYEVEGNKVLEITEVLKEGGEKNKVYDIAFRNSEVGIKYSEDNSEILLNYNNGKEVSVYKIENITGERINLNNKEHFVVIGNVGNDIISAGDNSAVIDGNKGDDIITGGNGNDWLKGGEGVDEIRGGNGHDIIIFDKEDMVIDGGNGYDVAIASKNEGVYLDLAKSNIEAVYGNRGNDYFDARKSIQGVYISGGAGNDIMYGSPYDDIIVGAEGKNTINAGDGNDHIYVNSEEDIVNNIDGGKGNDSLYISGTKAVNINLADINIENVYGTIGEDIIYSSGEEDVILVGNEGNDKLTGGGGNDIIDGGKGDDILSGGAGKNRYVYSKGDGKDIIVDLDQGENYLLFYNTIKKEDLVFTCNNKDLFISFRNTQEDSIEIRDWYASENNKLKGIILDANKESKSIVLKDTESTFRMDDGNSWIIYAVTGNNKIGGGKENDFILGGNGKDEIMGWDGDDILSGGKGDGDSLQGWRGDDTYFYNIGDGKDTILDEYKYEYIYKGTETRTKTVTETVQAGEQCYGVGFHGMEVCVPIHRNIEREVKYEVPYTETKIAYGNAGYNDKILLGYGIQKDGLCKKVIGNDIIIALLEKDQKPMKDLADSITIQQYTNTNNKIELIEFADSKETMNFTDVVNSLSTCSENVVHEDL